MYTTDEDSPGLSDLNCSNIHEMYPFRFPRPLPSKAPRYTSSRPGIYGFAFQVVTAHHTKPADHDLTRGRPEIIHSLAFYGMK